MRSKEEVKRIILKKIKEVFFILKEGILAIDKPFGITSFDVIFKLRQILNIKKMGHSGTLDPIATGVLPIFFGKATKVISFLQNTDKEYVARFKFGVETDTKDYTGKVIKTTKKVILKKELEEKIKEFKGKIWQTPPMYSAVKVNGKPLYLLARKGEVVERKKRQIFIYSLKCVDFNETSQEGELKVLCSSGTYIRSLICDLAKALESFGVLTELKRTKACGFCLNECLTLEEVKNLKEKEMLELKIYDKEYPFLNLKKIVLDELQAKQFMNGVKIKIKKPAEENMFRIYYKNFIGFAHYEDGFLKADRVFV